MQLCFSYFCVVLFVINQVNEKVIYKNMLDKVSLVCNQFVKMEVKFLCKIIDIKCLVNCVVVL